MNRSESENGETLIEVMITILVLAIGLVAVVGAMGTSIVASSAHRSYASAEVVAREYGELIKAKVRDTVPANFVPCPEAGDLEPAVGKFDRPGWTPTIDKVEWWIPGTSVPQGAFVDDRTACIAYFESLCPPPATPHPNCDPGLQRVRFSLENALTGTAHVRLTHTIAVRRGDT